MQDSHKIGILDIITVILERKYFFIISMVLFLITGVLLSIFLPKYYTAKAVVIPSQKQISPLLDNIIPGSQFTGILKSLNMMNTTDLDYCLAILSSRRLAEKIIDSLDLEAHLLKKKSQKKYFKEDILKAFYKNIGIREDKFGNIEIAVTDTSPVLSCQIANAMVAELDRINVEISKESAKNSRVFFEGRISEIKMAQDSALKKLTEFQVAKKFFHVDQQLKSSIEALAKLEGEKMGLELEIAQMRNRLGPGSNQVRVLSDSRAVLEKQIKTYMDNGSGEIMIALKSAPDLAVQYALLLRESKIQETLYEFAVQMYEQAKLSESNNVPTIQVLENASIPQKRTRPKRKIICLIFFFSGLSFSVLAILVQKLYSVHKAQNSIYYRKFLNAVSLLKSK